MSMLKKFWIPGAIAAVSGYSIIAATPVGAPNFSGTTGDGKSFDLSNALKKGPVLVYFISSSCPVTAQSNKFFDRIAKAYSKEKYTLVGVMNGGKDAYTAWQKNFKVSFPVVLDPDYKVIGGYKIDTSPSAVLIKKDGKIDKQWVGFSSSFLKEINTKSAKLIGKAAPAVDFTGAPASTMAG